MESNSYNREQLHQLVEQAQRGSELARNAVIRDFESSVRFIVAEELGLPQWLHEDGVAEGLIAVNEAIDSFDASKGAAFTTWARRNSEWRVIEFMAEELGLTTYQRGLWKRVRAVRQSLEQQGVEDPCVEAVIEAYRKEHGVTLRPDTVIAILWPPRANRDELRSEEIDEVEVPCGGFGSPESMEQAPLANRMHRDGAYAVQYALAYEALGPIEAPNFAVLLTLHVRCGMTWVEIRELAKSPTFRSEGFRSWEAVHFRFQLPVWVSVEWDDVREALFVRGGKVPKDPSTYGTRFKEAGERIERYLKEQWRS